jgi:hypothetical protein
VDVGIGLGTVAGTLFAFLTPATIKTGETKTSEAKRRDKDQITTDLHIIIYFREERSAP